MGIRGGAIVTADTRCAVPRHGGDHSARYLANAAIPLIGYIEVAGCIDGNAGWSAQLRSGSRTVVAAKSPNAVPRHGADHAIRHLANLVVKVIQNVDIACAIDRYAGWLVQRRVRGWAVSPLKQQLPFPATVVMIPLET